MYYAIYCDKHCYIDSSGLELIAIPEGLRKSSSIKELLTFRDQKDVFYFIRRSILINAHPDITYTISVRSDNNTRLGEVDFEAGNIETAEDFLKDGVPYL